MSILATSNEEYVRQIIKNLRKLDYIKPREIPAIDLYMDQVTTFMDENLASSKRFEDDKILTKTMINNYTKNHLLPAPKKKKYTKEHMLLLIFIYYFKNILTISDIQSIFEPLTEKFYDQKSNIDLENIYKEVFSYEREQVDILTKDVIRKFQQAEKAFSGKAKEEDREFLVCFTFICLLSFDVYVKKTMIENIIDQHIMKNFTGETDKKKSKEKNNEKNQK